MILATQHAVLEILGINYAFVHEFRRIIGVHASLGVVALLLVVEYDESAFHLVIILQAVVDQFGVRPRFSPLYPIAHIISEEIRLDPERLLE